MARPSGIKVAETVAAGVLIAMVGVSYNFAFAALIYRDELAEALPAGLGANLLANLIAGLILAVFSSTRGNYGGPQDTPAIVLAPAAGAIASIGGASVPTVIALVMATTLAIGVVLWVIGALGLGRFMRYLPYPVVAGFLGGLGLVLLLSGFELAIGDDGPFGREAVIRWVPAFLLGMVIYLSGRLRPTWSLLVPAVTLGAVPLAHIVRWVSGIDVAEAQSRGWLLGPFDEGLTWHPSAIWRFDEVDWSVFSGEITTVLPVLVLYPVSILLYLGGLEHLTKQSVDTNRDLRVNGLANLAVAPTGGIAVGTLMSESVISHRLTGPSRVAPVISALLNGAALLIGSSLLVVVPSVVVHAVVFFLGFTFIADWLWDTRNRLPGGEYLVVLAMAVVIFIFDFFIGVAFGILVAVLLFVVRYSRTRSVRHQFSSRERRSNVQWGTPASGLLQERGERSLILELDGFLFFGSAARLVEPVVDRLADATPLEVVVIDFHRVVGIDSDAVTSIDKLLGMAEDEGFAVVFSALEPADRDRLQAARGGDWGQMVHFEPDLDRSLEWCETRLLGSDAEIPSIDLAAWMGSELLDEEKAARLMAHWTEEVAAPGTTLVGQGDPPPGILAITSGLVSIYISNDGSTDSDTPEPGPSDSGNSDSGPSDSGTASSANGHTPPVGLRRRTLRPGSLLGEVSLYTGGTATASVVADTEVVLHRLSEETLVRLEHEDPELALAVHHVLGRLLAERVTHSDALIRAILRPTS